MADQRNCPNCGAPIEPFDYKCRYCGTTYLDLGVIDFDRHTPFFLRIKLFGKTCVMAVQPNFLNARFERSGACLFADDHVLEDAITPKTIIDMQFESTPIDGVYSVSYQEESI